MAGYLVFIYVLARSYIAFRADKAEMKVFRAKELYQKRLLMEDQVRREKKDLEGKFRELFTLYDMTKKITKSFLEEEAFQIFREKLDQNISVEDCRFLEPLSKEASQARKDQDCLLFPLKGGKKIFGYLSIRGSKPQDQQKVKILVNQFALVMRRIYLYKEIERLAITDSLTQIFTRRYMMERFDEELQRARTNNTAFSFLMLDVDFFKKVNDQYGHLVGDSVLRTVSKIMLENIREIDIAGRYGGEEFCIILPDTDSDGAKYVAERVRKAIESIPIKAYDACVRATVSIGISTFEKDGKKRSTLIDKADWALYRAKKLGRNQVCVFGVYEE